MPSDEKPPDNIQSIPSYRKVEKDAEGIETLGKLWPLMKLFGLVKEDLPIDKKALAGLRNQANELLDLPDKFNAAFSSRGWIAYEALNADLMRRTVALAQAGKVDEAESEILSYYRSEENVRWHLRTMMAVKAWRPRETLANLAMADYLAGRYHAAIPVILALMDGLVSDLATTGFFAEGTEMTAWDSVAGHSSGLQAICDIFNKGRRKTTCDEILLPYRHGIMHGRDLGYANEVVAAKTWGTLFAVREWALKVEQGTSKPPNESKEAASPLAELRESLETLERIQKEKEELGLWKPREPNSQVSAKEVMTDGSPERTALEVLTLWRMKNYGGIAGHLSALSGDESIAKRAGRIRQNIEPKQIESFQILAVADETPAISVVTAKVRGVASFALGVEYFFGLRMIYESPKGDILLRGGFGGDWKIIEASLYTPTKEADLLSNPRAIRIKAEES